MCIVLQKVLELNKVELGDIWPSIFPLILNSYIGMLYFRYTHVEAECPFITFDDLLNRLEDLICDVVDRVLKSPYGHIVHELNPNFQVPTRPFMRMNYADAITYLKENNITKEDGSFYEFGEVCFVIFMFSSRFTSKWFAGYSRNA